MINMTFSDQKKLIFSIFICLFAGFIGSYFTTPAIPTWFATLQKPSFAPPNWVFAPVWTSLYIMMGISLFLVWQKGREDKTVKAAIYLFAGQLVLNALWSFVFFGLRSPLLGLIEIIILWIAILATIMSFMKVSRTAAYLLIPYFLWVSFASIVNFSIWSLNR
ncbi:MAG: tryptophan-rich sensory protein [Candidatus Methanoperedens sp.]|nr:tryptophan-rich sensory protein [Candidatus Methanoperedens sp.]